MPRAGKLKMMSGRMVSARSKTGDPQCSAAASAWQNALRGNPAGMALDAAMKILGQCRAKARALKQAGQHRTAGNEAKAQALESRVSRGGPITAKDRLAKARELRAARQESGKINNGGASRAAGARAIVSDQKARPETIVASVRDRVNPLVKRGSRVSAFRPSSRTPAFRQQVEQARLARDHARELRAQRSTRVSPDSPAAAQRLAEIRARNAAGKAEAKPLHAQALEAARRVPAEKRVGEKVFVHHAWQEYRKSGGKLGLNEFKSGLANDLEGRRLMSRADLVQGMRPGDVKGSNVPYMGTNFNFIRTGQGGLGFGSKIQPREMVSRQRKDGKWITPVNEAERSRAAGLVAKLRAQRQPASSLREQAAKKDPRRVRSAAAARQGRYARATGLPHGEAMKERARKLAEIKPVREEQRRIMQQDSARFQTTGEPTKRYSRMGERARTNSYVDIKGDLPSYYASRSEAARFLAKKNLHDRERQAEADAEKARRFKLNRGRLMTGRATTLDGGGYGPQKKYAAAAKAKMNIQGFKREEISVATGGAPQKIKAEVRGGYAVHARPEVVTELDQKIARTKGTTHAITHVATGKRLPGEFTAARAKQIVASMKVRNLDANVMIKGKKADQERFRRAYMAMTKGR